MKTEKFPMRKGFYAQIKNLLILFCLLFSVSLITSCSDSEDEPKEEIQQEETTGSTDSNGGQNGTTNTNGHEYVDLGLPSGLLWATCNVGATNPEDYGDYYAWGEITTKTEYTTSNSLTNGKTMGDISGNATYDAARANWGETWRLPKEIEFAELRTECTWEWISQNGINGYKVTGLNGNSIFLPAGGGRGGSSLGDVGSNGNYWSSTPHESNYYNAEGLYFGQGIYIRGNYGRNAGINVRPVSNPVSEQPSTPSTGTISNGHEYVDLGLPSGLKWATCNIGATNPEDYGDYYAWGETETKSTYTSDNSTTYGVSMSDISGNAEYDAARANWGGTWRMPTDTEFTELRTNCTWTWTSQGGHNAYKVTGPNGNSIFLPAAGWRDGSSLNITGDYGYYWSSTPLESSVYNACSLFLAPGGYYRNYGSRSLGRSVRPVTD